MTKAELVRALRLLPDEYEIHIEGQVVASVELHTRGHSIFNALTEAFDEEKSEGVINLVAPQIDEG